MSNVYKGSAPKRGGNGYIEFHIGRDQHVGLYLQMIRNEPARPTKTPGTHTKEKISLYKLIEHVIVHKDTDLMRFNFSNPNCNNSAFVSAVLEFLSFDLDRLSNLRSENPET